MQTKKIVAIGDSFFYLNEHLDETGFRLTKGTLSRVMEKLSFKADLINIGQNGWRTIDWAERGEAYPYGDHYIVMLGTNDWGRATPLGTQRDYLFRTKGTILGSLGIIVERIKKVAPESKIFICNPVERTDCVNIADYYNNFKGSYEPYSGQTIEQIANAIYNFAREEGVISVNTHDKSGITCHNAVKFKRCFTGNGTIDLPYPNYTTMPFDPACGIYPYPLEAIGTTYDGIHPSDKGSESIARVIADAINRANLE